MNLLVKKLTFVSKDFKNTSDFMLLHCKFIVLIYLAILNYKTKINTKSIGFLIIFLRYLVLK